MARMNGDREVSGGQGVRIYGGELPRTPRQRRPDGVLLAAGPGRVRLAGESPDRPDVIEPETERLVFADGGAERIRTAAELTLVTTTLKPFETGAAPELALFRAAASHYTCPRPCAWQPVAALDFDVVFTDETMGLGLGFGPDGELQRLYWLHDEPRDVLAGVLPGTERVLKRSWRTRFDGWFVGGHRMTRVAPRVGELAAEPRPPKPAGIRSRGTLS